MSSCVSRKKLVYFQNIETLAEKTASVKNTTTIKANDLLSITVSSFDLEAVRPFNMTGTTSSASSNPEQGVMQQGYLVGADGTIEFPVVGTIAVAGLTRKELNDKLTKEISVYVKNPIVNINIINFKVTILGEVTQPGNYPVSGERITLPEALGLAGDLTIFGRRDNVLIIREAGGEKTYKYVDLTKVDLMDSEFYYLQQNDVVYVEPNKAQIQSSSFNRNTGVFISIASLLVTVMVLFTR